MIEELHIRGLGVIEDADLALAPGLTVVTGETGAGKTLLVTALQLLLGTRADAGLVRSGAAAALVEAVVAPPPSEAATWLDEHEDALVVSRELPAGRRSRARIGGRLAPVGALSDVLGGHVEIHAQHEHVRLARPEVQRQLLDRYAGETHDRTLRDYREAHRRWQASSGRLAQVGARSRERAREVDRLRAEVEEIDAAELDPSVDGALDTDIERLARAEEIRERTTQGALALGSEGAGDPLGVAIAALRHLDMDDPALLELRGRLEGLVSEIAELAADVRAYGEDSAADPARLETLQERKRTLTRLTRKYGADVTAVLAWADQARARIDELEAEDVDEGRLEAQTAEALAAVTELAGELRSVRRAAADELVAVVDGHLADLGMPHARFSVAVEALPEGEFTTDGADRVTFLLAPNPGEPFRPVATAASGGERSRVALAIEVALADVDEAAVLVFDEVDAGIGGATAMAVGEKLARLAAGPGGAGDGRQVLCVTHLAQLAAFADVHYVVEKTVVGGRTVTSARRVGEHDRVGELSRMLGGDATASAGMEHARELIGQAGDRRGRST